MNSLTLNKYWIFQKTSKRPTKKYFALLSPQRVASSATIVSYGLQEKPSAMINATLWTNASQVLASGETFMISYLAMRLWVFAHHP